MRFSTLILSVTLAFTCFEIAEAGPNGGGGPAVLTCESTTPAGEAASIHEIVCSGSAVPACGDPGQTVAFQGGGGNSDVSSDSCHKINICHATANEGHWNAITVDRSSVDNLNANFDPAGHASAAHSDRDKPKVDYFPEVSFKNPRGAAYGQGKLGQIGNKCGFICTEPNPIGCDCPLQVQCKDANGDLTDDWADLINGLDENDCQYEDCPEYCPESAQEYSDDFGVHEACVLHPDSDHPNCNYNCCDIMKDCADYDPIKNVGMCTLLVDASDPLTGKCEYDCEDVCKEPCITSDSIGENCWYLDDTAGICTFECCDEEQDCVGGTATLVLPFIQEGVCNYDESACGKLLCLCAVCWY